MKINFKSYLWLLFAGLFGFSSCSKDEETVPKPTLTLTPITSDISSTEGLFDLNDSLKIKVTLTAGEEITEFSIIENLSTGPRSLFIKNSGFTDKKNFTYNFSYKISENTLKSIEFKVKDNKGDFDSKIFSVNFCSEINAVSGTLYLFVPLSTGPSLSWFNSKDALSLNSNDAKSNSLLIDFGYYYGQSNKATFASPSNFPTSITSIDWSNKNTTEFKKIQGTVAFESISKACELEKIYNNGELNSPSHTITNLSQDQIIGFKTNSGKKAILKVTNIFGTFNENDKIEFMLKIQK